MKCNSLTSVTFEGVSEGEEGEDVSAVFGQIPSLEISVWLSGGPEVRAAV